MVWVVEGDIHYKFSRGSRQGGVEGIIAIQDDSCSRYFSEFEGKSSLMLHFLPSVTIFFDLRYSSLDKTVRIRGYLLILSPLKNHAKLKICQGSPRTCCAGMLPKRKTTSQNVRRHPLPPPLRRSRRRRPRVRQSCASRPAGRSCAGASMPGGFASSAGASTGRRVADVVAAAVVVGRPRGPKRNGGENNQSPMIHEDFVNMRRYISIQPTSWGA